jgi:FAD:protein FMN transferase
VSGCSDSVRAMACSRTATWQALGTSAVLRLAQHGDLQRAKVCVERELDAIDRACSRFRADSDLSRLNAAGGEPLEVDGVLIDALQVALRAARITEGAVDPCIGVAIALAGYDRDWSLMEQRMEGGVAAPGEAARPGAGAPAPTVLRARRPAAWRAIELDRARRLARLPAGVKLDLGATAKAWAADRAAQAAFRCTGTGTLVALGGDVATAGPPPPEGWQIRVTDDHRSDAAAPGQTIAIHDGGLATSSVTVRRWTRAGVPMHHIIDPATAQPARGAWRTVSVAAASCTDANIASTASILLSDRAPAWLSAQGLPARLVTHDGGVRHVGDWPAQRRQVAA